MTRRTFRHARTVPALALAALLGACAVPTPVTPLAPNMDRQFGESVRRARLAQTLDPQATRRNLGATTQLDGTAAANATERYQDSFKEPPPTFSIFGAPVSGR